MTNSAIENYNYHSDHRVTCEDSKWWNSLDEKRMIAYAKCLDGENEDEQVAFRWGVCPTCDGSGTHVNPSIDAGGLTSMDFAEDPDFAEDYFSGMYDVRCYHCHGKRVVPECADELYLKKIEDYYKAMADMRAEYLAEVRMGA